MITLVQKRDLLTRSKQARDALRADNVQLKQRGGLVGHRTLLGDYEDKRNEVCVMCLFAHAITIQ